MHTLLGELSIRAATLHLSVLRHFSHIDFAFSHFLLSLTLSHLYFFP